MRTPITIGSIWRLKASYLKQNPEGGPLLIQIISIDSAPYWSKFRTGHHQVLKHSDKWTNHKDDVGVWASDGLLKNYENVTTGLAKALYEEK